MYENFAATFSIILSADFINKVDCLHLGTLYIRRRNQLLRENAKKEVTYVSVAEK